MLDPPFGDMLQHQGPCLWAELAGAFAALGSQLDIAYAPPAVLPEEAEPPGLEAPIVNAFHLGPRCGDVLRERLRVGVLGVFQQAPLQPGGVTEGAPLGLFELGLRYGGSPFPRTDGRRRGRGRRSGSLRRSRSWRYPQTPVTSGHSPTPERPFQRRAPRRPAPEKSRAAPSVGPSSICLSPERRPSGGDWHHRTSRQRPPHLAMA
jgi:hypothetical protein